jgi:hypothetical protein
MQTDINLPVANTQATMQTDINLPVANTQATMQTCINLPIAEPLMTVFVMVLAAPLSNAHLRCRLVEVLCIQLC